MKPAILLKTAFIQLCKYSNLFGKCVDYYFEINIYIMST